MMPDLSFSQLLSKMRWPNLSIILVPPFQLFALATPQTTQTLKPIGPWRNCIKSLGVVNFANICIFSKSVAMVDRSMVASFPYCLAHLGLSLRLNGVACVNALNTNDLMLFTWTLHLAIFCLVGDFVTL
jgi:hypothetical protein